MTTGAPNTDVTVLMDSSRAQTASPFAMVTSPSFA